MSRRAWLAALGASMALATCGYAPMPPNGTQLCGPAGGKQCPDGYHCASGSSGASFCFEDGSGGGGAAATGVGGRAGAGGNPTIDGGMGGAAGTMGAAGTTGTGGQVVCAPANASGWAGSLSTLNSGTVQGPGYSNTMGVGLHVQGTSTNATAAAAGVGVVFTLNPCLDARLYSGVSLSVTGSVTGCSASFQVADVERSGPGEGGPGVNISALDATPQTVMVPWTTSNGVPAGPIDSKKVDALVWGFTIQPGATCDVDMVITSITFY